MKNFLKTYDKFLSLSNMQVKMYTDSTKELKNSMKKMDKFLIQLGSPHKKLDFIHIAGTSGKGSTAHLIHSIIHEDKQIVGTYLSPHTTSYLERFQLNGSLMKAEKLREYMQTIIDEYEIFLKKNEPMSFFELSTALAIYGFQKSGVDWCVLETGLGGQWDATNVIPRPVVAVITNIDKDHTHILGDSLSAIAREKSGIMKKGSVVFSGETRSSLRKIFKEMAIARQSALFFVPPPTKQLLNKSFDIKAQHNALLAQKVAKEIGIKDTVITTAFKKYKPLPCRFEIIQTNPTIILDGAHSPAKMNSTANRITSLNKKVRIVYGSVVTKDAESILKVLSPVVISITTTRFTHGFRKAINPAQLLKMIPKEKRAGYRLNPFQAFSYAKSLLKKDEILLVTGSLYLSGELRTKWISEDDIIKNHSSFAK